MTFLSNYFFIPKEICNFEASKLRHIELWQKK
jgi:hypothetical protein